LNAAQLTNAIIAFATLITAITGMIAVFRKVETKVSQLNGKIDDTNGKIDVVTEAVNGRTDNLLSRTAQLEMHLQDNQIPIPPDPSVKV
jgi:uncharacterized protein YoxC